MIFISIDVQEGKLHHFNQKGAKMYKRNWKKHIKIFLMNCAIEKKFNFFNWKVYIL